MKLLKYLAILVLALVAASGAAFVLIPTERLIAVAADEVRKATGRELTISGEVSPSIYPVLGATVTKAALSNADWASEENLATVGAATVGVRVLPLLSGRMEIEEIRLVDATIALEVAEDGRPNWAFERQKPGKAKADGASKGAPSPSVSGDESQTARDHSELARLGRVRVVLENAAVTFDNHTTGVSLAARELAVTATLEDPDAPLSVKGSGVFNELDAQLSLDLATPTKLLRGEEAQANLSVDFGPATLDYSGAITAAVHGGAPSAKGALNASASDIPGLLTALGVQPPKAPKDAFKSASLDGQLNFDGATADLSGLALTLDGQTVSGDVAVDPSGLRPHITASLLADDLDLRPYMRGPTSGGGKKAKGGDKKKAGAKSGKKRAESGWSKAPIDLSGLNSVDADVAIKAQSVLLEKGPIRNADIRVQLDAGVLKITINQLNMFDGGASGRIQINGAGVPKLAADMDIDSVQLLEILSTLANFDRLEGVGAVSMNVKGKGNSQHAIMNSLRGSSSVKLTDGAILGINLAAMVRNVTGAFTLDGNDARKTDFAEISANFKIKKGVARNSDLVFLGPLLRATGKGKIDIGARTLNYRVTPRAVASLVGQGGDAGLGGIAVPVVISGPWSKPKYTPDLAGAITGVVTDPSSVAGSALGTVEGTEGLVEELGSGLGGALKGLLGK